MDILMANERPQTREGCQLNDPSFEYRQLFNEGFVVLIRNRKRGSIWMLALHAAVNSTFYV